MRAQADERLAQVLRQSGGTPEARSIRETATTMYGEQVAQLNAVENGLCFGRLDFHDRDPAAGEFDDEFHGEFRNGLDGSERRYIGRIGIFDADGDHRPLLLDWRAPA